jgi:hypothetical protein
MPYQITEDERLIRRIPRKPSHINNGRITSACFKTRAGEDGLSVNIENLVDDSTTIYNPITHRIAAFEASIPLNDGYECIHNPQDGNDSHALVVGNTNPIAKKLAVNSIFID